MNLCIFGGTFDPPHICHSLACLYALETRKIEKILVIPCFRHPLGKETTPFQHRLVMSRLAMECLSPKVEVSDMESLRKGPSYTLDTLKILRTERPGDNLSFLIGSDILAEANRWKHFEEIKKIAEIIILPRLKPGKIPGEPEEMFAFPDISSTEIRNRIKMGKEVSPFLSNKVLDYIKIHNLYK